MRSRSKEQHKALAERAELKRRYTDSVHAKVRKCVAEGMRTCDIQERLGVSTTLVRNIRLEVQRNEVNNE